MIDPGFRAVLGDKVYYLANTGSAVRLKSYDPAKMEWKVLTTPEISLEHQVAASTNHLFVLGTDRTIYSVEPSAGALSSFAAIEAPALSSDQKVNSYSIEAMSGQVNVYANIAKANEAPTFTFMEFTTDAASSDETRILIAKHTLTDEPRRLDAAGARQAVYHAQARQPRRSGEPTFSNRFSLG